MVRALLSRSSTTQSDHVEAQTTQLALHSKEVHEPCGQAFDGPVLAHIHLLQVRTLSLRTGPSKIFLLRG